MSRPSSRDSDFTSFVGASHRSLLHTAYLLFGDRGHAEDLVQTALVRTYTAWPRLREPAAAHAYARTTLVRASQRWRSRRWHGEVPFGVLPQSVADQDTDRTDVRRALASLPAGQRAVLVLRFFEDLCCSTTTTTGAERVPVPYQPGRPGRLLDPTTLRVTEEPAGPLDEGRPTRVRIGPVWTGQVLVTVTADGRALVLTPTT